MSSLEKIVVNYKRKYKVIAILIGKNGVKAMNDSNQLVTYIGTPFSLFGVPVAVCYLPKSYLVLHDIGLRVYFLKEILKPKERKK